MRTEAISINPATGEEIARHPALDGASLERVLAAASTAFADWRTSSVGRRAEAFLRLADTLEARRETLARLITLEMGKPITAAGAEVDKCARLARWYAENLPDLLADETPDVGGDGTAVISYLPLGVVLGVMPWNFPLWQVLRAAVPIICAGNGFLLKHAENVQGSALALGECFRAAAFPEGLFGVVHADRALVTGLLADRRIVGVSVTAGVAAGASLAAEAGRHIKKSLLELGGSDPFIVLADADLDLAVAAAVEARFQNCGQVCIAAKRIIVEAPIMDVFVTRFVEAARGILTGDPLDPATRIGPMARVRARSDVHDQVCRSVAMGARVLLGGEIPDGPGAYYPPTVLIDVTPDMPICAEETFGPVAAIMAAKDAEDAVHIANNSDFGLSAALWTADVEAADRLARRIEAGAVFVNGMSVSDPRVPIGGVKRSGYGRELSHFGLREFCNAQLRWVRR
ncbi:succinate-semialdehyde dehydrogenase [Tardibacter chloracetimidivorans]|jgi:succinate-semialdehyde dehydrogenase|uniref:Succinate-semialdehyde dehydrogenase n=1 Tax=Tardibacter chloracetimidivorans TaxID=1921510 RepID=A0A1L3ZXB5_9SPHN|nr:NAD-dependent succinate-semialdehyde dehydrogenase [Tardibacter chloracetimidivorans]API60250.1 succinate-semialdehyde dehydrogenase [Tardibacter chloracetimidivorans]